MRHEPVVTGVVGLDVAVAALLTLGVSFGWLDLSAEQAAAVVGAVAAVSAVVAGLVRARVRPVVSSVSVEQAELWGEAGVFIGEVTVGADDGGGAGGV